MNSSKMAIQPAEKGSRTVVCQRNSLVVAKNKLTGKFHEPERDRNGIISLAILVIVYNTK